MLTTSAMAFEALKHAGAAYLVWLGIKAWRGGDPQQASTGATPPIGHEASRSTVYWRSVVTGVLNPKVALFFLAFLPQFVHPERGLVWLQFLVLGALLSILGFCNSAMLSLMIGRFGRRASPSDRWARWRQRAVGSVFIGIGLRLAAQQRV